MFMIYYENNKNVLFILFITAMCIGKFNCCVFNKTYTYI